MGGMLALGSIGARGFAIIVSKQDKRFVNELDSRDEMCETEMRQEGDSDYFVLSCDPT